MSRAAQKAKIDAAYQRLADTIVAMVWQIAKREIARAASNRPARQRRTRRARIAA